MAIKYIPFKRETYGLTTEVEFDCKQHVFDYVTHLNNLVLGLMRDMSKETVFCTIKPDHLSAVDWAGNVLLDKAINKEHPLYNGGTIEIMPRDKFIADAIAGLLNRYGHGIDIEGTCYAEGQVDGGCLREKSLGLMDDFFGSISDDAFLEDYLSVEGSGGILAKDFSVSLGDGVNDDIKDS